VNRSIAGIAAGVLLFAIALTAFPIWALGREQFDVEQELGILLVPFGLITFLIAATTADPRTTTVGGAFGNREYDRLRRAEEARSAPRPRVFTNYSEAVHCRHCNTIIPPDLANCPRCGRARICRSCHRLLGMVLERPTCASCGRAEPLCDCSILPLPTAPAGRARPYSPRR
jgi:RNA polymerase subunit RPABC4/transcription elongation factor Spt4